MKNFKTILFALILTLLSITMISSSAEAQTPPDEDPSKMIELKNKIQAMEKKNKEVSERCTGDAVYKSLYMYTYDAHFYADYLCGPNDGNLANLFLEKVFRDLESGNPDEFNLAMGMLLSMDNIIFLEKAEMYMSLSYYNRNIYNWLISSIRDYRKAVISIADLTQPDLIKSVNEPVLKNLRNERNCMLRAYTKYRFR